MKGDRRKSIRSVNRPFMDEIIRRKREGMIKKPYMKVIRGGLRDRLSIPMLTIELDIGDKRFNSIYAVKYEIAEFAKTWL